MSKPIISNTLFYGDNLSVLREHFKTKSAPSQTFKQAEKVKKIAGKTG